MASRQVVIRDENTKTRSTTFSHGSWHHDGGPPGSWEGVEAAIMLRDGTKVYFSTQGRSHLVTGRIERPPKIAECKASETPAAPVVASNDLLRAVRKERDELRSKLDSVQKKLDSVQCQLDKLTQLVSKCLPRVAAGSECSPDEVLERMSTWSIVDADTNPRLDDGSDRGLASDFEQVSDDDCA